MIEWAQPSAQIVPFPSTRRVKQIEKTAAFMASVSPQHAEKHLTEQIKRLTTSLHRRGISTTRIAHECTAYETAVRVAVWKHVLLGDAR